MTEPNQQSASERRMHARISAEIPIKVQIPGRAEVVTAINQDLSWGGARCILGTQFILPEAVQGAEEGVLTLFLPWTGGEQIEVEATIARTHRLDDGRFQVAVRFRSLTPRNQARLEKLLTMLWPGRSERGVPLVQELVLHLADPQELRHMLEQTRSGELSVSTFDPYYRDQSIRFVIKGEGHLPSIGLRARVLKVKMVPGAEFGGRELYALRLGFEHPLANIREVVNLLLEQLPPPPAPAARPNPQPSPSSAPASASPFQDRPPAWLRSAQQDQALHPAVTTPPPAPESLDRSPQCALESRHQSALTYLSSVWGDPDAFDAHFQELVMGDYAEPGGWPDDAWSELALLQDVHDLAYGIPSYRNSPLRGGRSI